MREGRGRVRGAAGDVQERRRQPGREEVAGARGRARHRAASGRGGGRRQGEKRRWAGPAGGAGPGGLR